MKARVLVRYEVGTIFGAGFFFVSHSLEAVKDVATSGGGALDNGIQTGLAQVVRLLLNPRLLMSVYAFLLSELHKLEASGRNVPVDGARAHVLHHGRRICAKVVRLQLRYRLLRPVVEGHLRVASAHPLH